MKRIICGGLILLMFLSLFSGCQRKMQKFTDYSFDYFDTVTSITGYERTKQEFDTKCREVKAELEKYHKLYDIYNNYQGINNLYTLNKLENSQHTEVKVDKAIIDLLQFSYDMYKKSSGKLNIAMGSVLSIWSSYRSEGVALPPYDLLKDASEHINIEDIIINKEKNTVLIKDNKMSLDVGAVAKGYTVNQVAQLMKNKGFEGYILNVGGNVCTIGKRPDGENWQVGIENWQNDSDRPFIEILEWQGSMSLVTSGSYQRFYTVNGINYHHIIDSATLYPAEYFTSVSVLCDNSAIGDMLSTTLFCLNYEEGLEVLKQFNNVEVMWIRPDGTRLYTDGFKKYCVKG